MKWGADLQDPRALGATFVGQFGGAFHRSSVTGNNNLLLRIDIRWFTDSPSAASRQTAATLSNSRPKIPAIEQTPTGTASCIYLPRFRTVRTASVKLKVPAATCAEYSPRLCPATKRGLTPFSFTTRQAATDAVRIAGCVTSVNRS